MERFQLDFLKKYLTTALPPALVEGRVYEAGGPPVTMSNGFLRFVTFRAKEN
jgi:hypothetical protein